MSSRFTDENLGPIRWSALGFGAALIGSFGTILSDVVGPSGPTGENPAELI